MPTAITYQKPKKKPTVATYPQGHATTRRFPHRPGIDLPDTISITKGRYLAALLEVGYGASSRYESIFGLTAAEKLDFAKQIKARRDWLVSSLSFAKGKIQKRSFARVVESTEMGNESYFHGMAIAYIATKHWQPKVLRVLHLATFSNTTVVKKNASLYFSRSPASKSLPDLACSSKTGQWHIVEAKGGGQQNRNKKIREGLTQLDAVMRIGAYGKSPKAPQSRTCTHVTIDNAGSDWEIHVVDPDYLGEADVFIDLAAEHLQLAELQMIQLEAYSSNSSSAGTKIQPNQAVKRLWLEYAVPWRLEMYGMLRSMVVERGFRDRLFVRLQEALTTAETESTAPPPSQLKVIMRRLKHTSRILHGFEKESNEYRLLCLKAVGDILALPLILKRMEKLPPVDRRGYTLTCGAVVMDSGTE